MQDLIEVMGIIQQAIGFNPTEPPTEEPEEERQLTFPIEFSPSFVVRLKMFPPDYTLSSRGLQARFSGSASEVASAITSDLAYLKGKGVTHVALDTPGGSPSSGLDGYGNSFFWRDPTWQLEVSNAVSDLLGDSFEVGILHSATTDNSVTQQSSVITPTFDPISVSFIDPYHRNALIDQNMWKDGPFSFGILTGAGELDGAVCLQKALEKRVGVPFVFEGDHSGTEGVGSWAYNASDVETTNFDEFGFVVFEDLEGVTAYATEMGVSLTGLTDQEKYEAVMKHAVDAGKGVVYGVLDPDNTVLEDGVIGTMVAYTS